MKKGEINFDFQALIGAINNISQALNYMKLKAGDKNTARFSFLVQKHECPKNSYIFSVNKTDKEMRMMTLVELQKKLGEQIEMLTDKGKTSEEKKAIAEIAQTVSSLAKQMINNADVVLRTEKLVSEGKLNNSAIRGMVK